jgi:hypothetical protein
LPKIANSHDKGSPRGDNDINIALDELGRDLGGARRVEEYRQVERFERDDASLSLL